MPFEQLYCYSCDTKLRWKFLLIIVLLLKTIYFQNNTQNEITFREIIPSKKVSHLKKAHFPLYRFPSEYNFIYKAIYQRILFKKEHIYNNRHAFDRKKSYFKWRAYFSVIVLLYSLIYAYKLFYYIFITYTCVCVYARGFLDKNDISIEKMWLLFTKIYIKFILVRFALLFIFLWIYDKQYELFMTFVKQTTVME